MIKGRFYENKRFTMNSMVFWHRSLNLIKARSQQKNLQAHYLPGPISMCLWQQELHHQFRPPFQNSKFAVLKKILPNGKPTPVYQPQIHQSRDHQLSSPQEPTLSATAKGGKLRKLFQTKPSRKFATSFLFKCKTIQLIPLVRPLQPKPGGGS
jgi:hypothetical protein